MTWNVHTSKRDEENKIIKPEPRRNFIESQEFEAPDVLFIQEAKEKKDVQSVRNYLENNGGNNGYECHPIEASSGDAYILFRPNIGTSFEDVTADLSDGYVYCDLLFFFKVSSFFLLHALIN